MRFLMSADIKQSPEFWDAIADSLEKQAAEARTQAFRLRSEQSVGQSSSAPKRSVNRGEAAHKRLLELHPYASDTDQALEDEAQKDLADSLM